MLRKEILYWEWEEVVLTAALPRTESKKNNFVYYESMKRKLQEMATNVSSSGIYFYV